MDDNKHISLNSTSQKELKKQAEELQRERDKLRLEDKLKDKALDLKTDEYRKAQELRAKQLEEKKQLSTEQRLHLQEELLSYLENIYSEKLKKQALVTELAIEEKDAKERAKEHEIETKRKKIQEELQNVYDMQLYVQKQKQASYYQFTQKKEEELYRQNLMAKLYEEDKLDLMSQHKQRQKKLEHMRITQAMLEESRKKKAAERATELADLKYQEELETERVRMVKEEKIRFLKEHACELLGYLPKGLIEDNQTVEQLGNDFKKFYFRDNCK
ncbi:meiosis-specific nuclear structural protein 1 [Caerostris extrusa]|uniref:Meiosis-specific nuclear structural protein 1 n=1 Tax=Caerostris extrusa TaxID=172846 RepID=A0AAV4QCI2_CAEEX|nr:meiosis-specific nuclear structural protein 1 [Caerostris extrusa]